MNPFQVSSRVNIRGQFNKQTPLFFCLSFTFARFSYLHNFSLRGCSKSSSKYRTKTSSTCWFLISSRTHTGEYFTYSVISSSSSRSIISTYFYDYLIYSISLSIMIKFMYFIRLLKWFTRRRARSSHVNKEHLFERSVKMIYLFDSLFIWSPSFLIQLFSVSSYKNQKINICNWI